MGDGLKRVAKLCGGLTVEARGEMAHHNANGERWPVFTMMVLRNEKWVPYAKAEARDIKSASKYFASAYPSLKGWKVKWFVVVGFTPLEIERWAKVVSAIVRTSS